MKSHSFPILTVKISLHYHIVTQSSPLLLKVCVQLTSTNVLCIFLLFLLHTEMEVSTLMAFICPSLRISCCISQGLWNSAGSVRFVTILGHTCLLVLSFPVLLCRLVLRLLLSQGLWMPCLILIESPGQLAEPPLCGARTPASDVQKC